MNCIAERSVTLSKCGLCGILQRDNGATHGGRIANVDKITAKRGLRLNIPPARATQPEDTSSKTVKRYRSGDTAAMLGERTAVTGEEKAKDAYLLTDYARKMSMDSRLAQTFV